MKVELYSDGAARGNPEGPGGFGCILRYIDKKGSLHEKEISRGYKKTTNNRMELLGVIAGLEALNTSCEVSVYSDSKYVTDSFNKGWIDKWQGNGWKTSKKDPVLNEDLWRRLLKAMEGHRVTYNWVKGHDGNPCNERCDKLATGAADSGDLLDDIAGGVL
ncbi:MAG: ribonuclease HI [Lachnospiraceae bacterium]|nr:ribonuclease HI [Lachnospiraceae bacterium]